MSSGVFIAMPVYRGEDVIEETIRSILDQEFEDFHLVISVDGEDDPTVEICRKYTSDPRIDVVVQQHRLGWPGNFNWLVENCDREFFCYWQQDDLASTGYLRSLRKELLARPDASIAHTDVQWFGRVSTVLPHRASKASPSPRVMQHIEAIRYEPLRGRSGLRRLREATPSLSPRTRAARRSRLPDTDGRGRGVRAHGSGDVLQEAPRRQRVQEVVRLPEWRRRRGWLSMGSGMYHLARQHARVPTGRRSSRKWRTGSPWFRIGRGRFRPAIDNTGKVLPEWSATSLDSPD